MSGVTQINTTTGVPCVGPVTFTSTQPRLITVTNTPTAPYTVNFSPVSASVNSLQGLNGDINLTTPDGCLGVAPVFGGNVAFNAYNETTNTSAMVASNISGAMAWQGSGGPPAVSTVAYAIGAVVIYSGTTFMCLVAQPVGSAIPVSGANWAVIGGGGGSGSSISNGGASVSCSAGSVIISQDDTVLNSVSLEGVVVMRGTTSFGSLSVTTPAHFSNSVLFDGLLTFNGVINFTTQVTFTGPSPQITPDVMGGVGGPAIFYCGSWSPTAVYAIGAAVLAPSSSPPTNIIYICILPVPPVVPPATNTPPIDTPLNWAY